MITVEVDVEQALTELGAMVARTQFLGPVLEVIGQSEVENAKARIQQSKMNPWGGDWAPWANSTAAHRMHKGNASQGLLWDDGDLLNSIRFAVDAMEGISWVDIGSDLEYAAYLQNGTEDMPAREFLGWNDAVLPFYEGLLLNYIETGTP